MSDRLAGLRVPTSLVPRVTDIVETTDRFCAEHLDAEYAELCRQLVGRLARKRPSPLASGPVKTWAGAVLHAIGTLNFLFDRTQRPHMTVAELCRLAGISQSTAARRSREIRDLLRLVFFEPGLTRGGIVEQSPLGMLVQVDGGLIAPLDLLRSIDEDELVESYEAQDRHAVQVLRQALPDLVGLPEPAALRRVAADLRGGLSTQPVLQPVVRANGWSRDLPPDDLQLWIEAAGALIRMKDDPGLSVEDQSLLMALEHADLLGAVVGVVRSGVGSPAGPRHLTAHIDACPEVDGAVDDDDREVIEAGFGLLVPVWQAVGALDRDQRLTDLGHWGLPRALARAWGGGFDPL